MNSFDFASSKATPHWVTGELTRTGYLHRGNVTHVEQVEAPFPGGASSKMFALTLGYSDGSSGERPSKCIMKVSNPQQKSEEMSDRLSRYTAWSFLPQHTQLQNLTREVLFYEEARNIAGKLPLMACYGSSKNDAAACLLLEDLSKTHHQPTWPLAPSVAQCESTITAVATTHAHWWSHLPHLEGAQLAQEVIAVFERCYSSFADQLGDRLSRPRRQVYQRALEQLPTLIANRMEQPHGSTRVHGDAHHWNVLLPNEGARTILYDWQTWRTDIPAFDLAYMMGVWWHREHRDREEARLLAHYSQQLQNLGVDYPLTQLHIDYRLCVIRHLFTPVILSSFVIPAVWWPHVDRIFCTFEDWSCEELLTS